MAFPAFFFAVIYLIQMFFVLRAEVMIAEAGITSAREVAAYSYVAERLADGENAAAEKLLSLFDQKLVRDVAMTSLFYVRCDDEILTHANVGQGLLGVWVDTIEEGEKLKAELHYRVAPKNAFMKERPRTYTMRIVYRGWTGEGKLSQEAADSEEAKKGEVVYMTEHGKVYHVKKTCSHIKIDAEAVLVKNIGSERNNSGAKYYACEFCAPISNGNTTVYITRYGTRYHAVSSCSAIKRNVKECSLEEIEKRYPVCSRCGKE